MERGLQKTGALLLTAVFGLGACATPGPPPTQSIEVRLEAEDAAWTGPLSCEAHNDLGRWRFTAPGTVTVTPSTAALHVSCEAPPGAVTDAEQAPPRTREAARAGEAAGARLGAVAGAAAGVAAVPFMGPLAVLFVFGGAMQGATIGGIVGTVSSAAGPRYPDVLVIHVRRPPPDD